MGATPILTSPAHPIHLLGKMHFSWEMWDYWRGNKKAFQRYEIYSQDASLQERNNGPYFLCQIYIGMTYFHNAFSELYNKLLEMCINAYVGMNIMPVQRKSANYIDGLYVSFSPLSEDWLTGKKEYFLSVSFNFI